MYSTPTLWINSTHTVFKRLEAALTTAAAPKYPIDCYSLLNNHVTDLGLATITYAKLDCFFVFFAGANQMVGTDG